jgi:dTDP-4-dehydrorhamnose 3,5-epimerase
MSGHFPRIEQDAVRRSDERGYLEVLYESDRCVLKRSYSHKGAFRGLHWQDEHSPQVKIIRVLQGRIADFLVDMSDPHRVIHHDFISPSDGWVRIGAHYAHGLYALEDTLFEYFCDGGYDESSEQAFAITDQIRQILGVEHVILSDKDMKSQPLIPAQS